jgi:hypothetical protein
MFIPPKRYTNSPLGHSADIALWLHVSSQRFSLAQTGPSSVMLDGDAIVPVGPARVEVVVDGRSHFSDVTIIGRKTGSQWVDISRANANGSMPVKQAS